MEGDTPTKSCLVDRKDKDGNSPKEQSSEGKVWMGPFRGKLDTEFGNGELLAENENSLNLPGLGASAELPSTMAFRFNHAASRKRYCRPEKGLEAHGTQSKSLPSLRNADCLSQYDLSNGQQSPLPRSDENLDGEVLLPAQGFSLINFILSGIGRLTFSRFLHFSVLLLFVIATLFNVTSPKGRWRSGDSSFFYNFLSTEVPPSSGLSSSVPDGGLSSSKRGLKLGPAMIESVTDALGPVLPFAGGIDLRREENWNWEDATSKRSIAWFRVSLPNLFGSSEQTSSNDTPLLPNDQRKGNTLDRTTASTATRSSRKQTRRSLVLAAIDPFISTEIIAQLTLGEVGLIFRYASNVIKSDFDAAQFRKKGSNGREISRPLAKVLNAMDDAVKKSRGDGVSPPLQTTTRSNFGTDKDDDERFPTSKTGEIDALQFCAAMRLFAEWRLVRLVPDNHKGFAVGMRLGHKDVVQNIAKIETMIFEMMESQQEADGAQGIQIRSPTLREILVDEIENDVHPTSSLPRLKEKTAAMGLLWVRRQLDYQTKIFTNLLKIPEIMPTSLEAVVVAYDAVYGELHGWAVRKIFNYSFQAGPEADVTYRFMNPVLLQEVTEQALNGIYNIQALKVLNIAKPQVQSETTSNSLKPVTIEQGSPRSEENESSGTELSDHCKNVQIGENPFAKFGAHLACELNKIGRNTGKEMDKVGRHVGNELDKIASNAGKVFNKGKSNPRGAERRREISSVCLGADELDRYIDHMMASDAHKNIFIYLEVANELLADLKSLFAEMNMDDPTRV